MAMDKIGHYSITNPATVYDEESMTALELAGRVAAKMNEAIGQYNELETNTTADLKKQNEDIHNMRYVVLPEAVAMTVLQYIADGKFDEAIGLYLDGLNFRVDNLLGSVTEGSTTLDAEVIDIRVGADNQTYANAGEAVRGQLAKVSKGIVDFMESINMFTTQNETKGKYLGSATALYDNEVYNTTDYLPITVTDPVWFSKCIRFIACYDELYQPVTDGYLTKESADVTRFTIPDGTKFIRVSYQNNMGALNLASIMITSGVHRIPYQSFKPFVKPEHLPEGVKIGDIKAEDLAIMTSDNILNPAKTVTGYMGKDGYAYDDNTSYFYTEYLPVSEGEIVHFQPNARFITAFDADYTVLPEAGAENYATYEVPANVAYIIVTMPSTSKNSSMINKGAIALPFVAYRSTIDPKYLPTTEDFDEKDLLICKSMIGGNAERMEGEQGSRHDALTNYPKYIKKNNRMSWMIDLNNDATTDVTGFGGYFGFGFGSYGGGYIYLGPASVLECHYTSTQTTVTPSIAHGLTFKNYLIVTLTMLSEENIMRLTMSTNGGYFTHDFTSPYNWCGQPFIDNFNVESTSLILNATCSDFSEPIWCFGDSYSNFTDERVFKYLADMGFTNYYLASLSGGTSAGMYEDFLLALNYGTPKYVLWLCGMNDSDASHKTYVNRVREVCASKGITPIFVVPPCVPSIDHTAKRTFLETTGERLIRWDYAVGADDTGAWYTDYLSGDNVHPSEIGAKVIAQRMLIDVPELMSY